MAKVQPQSQPVAPSLIDAGAERSAGTILGSQPVSAQLGPGPVGVRSPLIRSFRWLALPLGLLLLVMVGIAAMATEPAPDNPSGEAAPGESAGSTSGNRPTERPEERAADFEPITITAQTDRGDVEITFDVGVVRLQPTGPGTGPRVDLVPGTQAGHRLAGDGRLEPVAPSRLDDQEIGFRAAEDGLTIDVPGDDPVLLRPDGERGGVSATDVSLGNEPIVPDANGEVVLADGTTLTPIENPGPRPQVVLVESQELPWTWIFGTIAAVAAISALTGFLLHRRRPEPQVTDAGFMMTAGVETMSKERFEAFLHELEHDPDPNRAVRLAFHAAEQGLGLLPPRRRPETPNEWASRVAQVRAELAEPLAALCDLFARARFGPEPVDDDLRRRAVDLLRLLQAGGDRSSTASPSSHGHHDLPVTGAGR